MTFLTRWWAEFKRRQQYAAHTREPFFELAARYLPDEDAVVVDVGAGDGSFARSQDLAERYHKLYLLDHNPTTVGALKEEFPDAQEYRAPEQLPFKDGEVAFIHLSHIVEHLESKELYAFLAECDRVLGDGGVLVISAPLLWDRFYDDLSHVKPYTPTVFVNYLSSGRVNASAETISRVYRVEDLVYRFRVTEGVAPLSSRFFIIDVLLRASRILLAWLGFRRYEKTGFTLVLRKSDGGIAV